MNTATDLYPGQFGQIGRAAGQELMVHRPDNNQGFGRVNMDMATNLGNYTLVDSQGVTTGGSRVYKIQFPGGGKFSATLVYTDAPGAPNAAKALVNDLDLEVLTPSGQTLAPHDRINNDEVVEIQNAPAGTYQVAVVGYNVPAGISGRQPFSLVVNAPAQQ